MGRYAILCFLYFISYSLFAQSDSSQVKEASKIVSYSANGLREFGAIEEKLNQYIDTKKLYNATGGHGYSVKVWFKFNIDSLREIIDTSLEVFYISGIPSDDLKLREDFIAGCKKYILSAGKLQSTIAMDIPYDIMYYYNISIRACR